MSDLRFIYRLITRSIYELLALTNELIDITVIKSVPPREDIKLKICLSVLLIGDLAIYASNDAVSTHVLSIGSCYNCNIYPEVFILRTIFFHNTIFQ